MRMLKITAVLILLCTVHVFAQNGVITELSGTVELKRSDRAAFIQAKKGDTVAKDTVVSTGFKSSAVITIGSAVITVKPITKLTLQELTAAGGRETINVSLDAGRLRVDVKPPSGTATNMTVRSPTVTASVRGTSFELDTQSLSVLEGTVAFQGKKGGLKLVDAGSSCEITQRGNAGGTTNTAMAKLSIPSFTGRDSGFKQNGNSGGGFQALGLNKGPDRGDVGLSFNLR